MPISDDRLTRALKIVALVLLSLALLYVALMFLGRISPVVIVVLGAAFLAYLLYPPIHWLQRYHWPRWLAILSVYAVLALIIGGIMAFIGPRLTFDARALAQEFPILVRAARDGILNTHTSILAAVPIESRESVLQFFNQVVAELERLTGTVAGQALTLVVNVGAVLTGVIIAPILALYILLDLERLREGVIGLFPIRYRSNIIAVLGDIDRVVGGFVRGQVIIAAAVAVAVSILLLALRVKFALLIGLFAGVMDIIPYVGAVIGGATAALVALLNQGFLWMVLVVAGFILINQLEGHLLSPLIMGQRVGLPPLMIIIAILTGAELGGIIGMFVSVPIAALIRVLWIRFARPAVITDVKPEHLAQPAKPLDQPERTVIAVVKE